MYTVILLLESSLIISAPNTIIFGSNFADENQHTNNTLLWMIALDILFVIVWYVVSRLSIVVRTHEHYLVDAYKKINQAQEEKDQYAVLMTHQLKSPLDAIRSKINLINAGYCGDASDETKETLMKIDRRAKSMSDLILDLLRLQRLKETCLDTAAFEPIDINETLQKCVEKLIPVVNAKQIALDLKTDNFIYYGIPDQLEILLENIISNAIAYSHDNSKVEISLMSTKITRLQVLPLPTMASALKVKICQIFLMSIFILPEQRCTINHRVVLDYPS